MTSKASGILAQARANPAGIRFRDLVRLVEAAGFVLDRQKGSHRVYRRAGLADRINLRPQGSMAKAYQVRQVLSIIATHKIEVV